MMSEQEANTQESNAPVFRLQKMYVKDFSFENPNAPGVFMIQQSTPKVEVNLALKNQKLEGDHWEVILSITAKVSQGEENKALFVAEIEHAGIFLLQNIPQDHLKMVLAVDCPALLFPFTRQILCQVSVDGGYIPFLMEPVNFMALYQNQKKKQGQENQ